MPTFTRNWKDTLAGVGHTYQLRLIVNQKSQNIAANTTTFSWRLEVKHTSNYTGVWMNGDAGYWNAYAPSGSNVGSGTQQGYDFRGGGKTLVLGSGENEHANNADGTYSRVWGATWNAKGSLAPGTSVSGTVTATRIPRATAPNWSQIFTTGSAQTINLPRASSGFTHDVTYAYGALSGTIATGAGTSTSWTPPHSLFNQASTRSMTSGNGTIKVVTKSGSTVIGTISRGFTVALSSTQIPTVSGVTWTDQNPTIAANIGAFVQSLSLVKGSVSASGVLGSTITSRSLVIGGQNYSESDVIAVRSAGTITASGRAVDSRGRVGTRAANFSVLAWRPPTASNFLVRRANSDGTLNSSGVHLRLTLNASVSSLIVGGAQKNTLQIEVFTRPSSSSTWTKRNTISPTGLSYNSSINITGGGIYLANQSYEVMIRVRDNTGITPTEAITLVPTSAVTMHWKGTGVGIGKYHERGALDVGPGGIYSDGSLVLNNSDIEMLNITTQNLNTFTTPGYRFQNSTANATSARNYPPGGLEAGALEVIPNTSGTFLTQRFTTYNSMRVFFRTLYSASWSAWTEIARTSQIPPQSDQSRVGTARGATQAQVNAGTVGSPYYVQPGTLRNRNYAPWAMATGYLADVSIAAGQRNQTTVTFPSGRFSAEPVVTVTAVSPFGDVTAVMTSATSTSFVATRGNLGTTSRSVGLRWTAVQMSSGSGSG